MSKHVLDVGQCDMDHESIRLLIENHFNAKVFRAHAADDTLSELRRGAYDLILINRKLDRDQSDGVDIIHKIKSDPELADVPVMLVTNFPEHQQIAVSAGACRGFGKAALHTAETRQKLKELLGVSAGLAETRTERRSNDGT